MEQRTRDGFTHIDHFVAKQYQEINQGHKTNNFIMVVDNRYAAGLYRKVYSNSLLHNNK